jgi:hypothetical protein
MTIEMEDQAEPQVGREERRQDGDQGGLRSPRLDGVAGR